MKKWHKILAVVLATVILGGVAALFLIPGSNPGKDTHLILNKDSSYGGTLSEKKYGKGAPLNGEYDVEDSPYYNMNNDYYTLASTEERVIIPQFSSYQQTMQDSSGLACLLMILNYMGEDVQKEYNELALVKKYEEVNDTQVYGNGTTEEGLIRLIESLGLGYTAVNEDAAFKANRTKEGMKTFLIDSIREGKFVLARYQSPVGYGWKVVIGYDDLGKIKNTATGEMVDHVGDDVVILAEPYDGFDHRQDGYTIERARVFYAWWRQMLIDGEVLDKYSFVVVDPNLDITFDYQPVDETVKQTLYDKNLPLNADGTYGGTRNEELYGKISSGNGWWDHPESNYYKINDFYNMGSEGTRILLKNYTVLQQTMSSSCGICAIGSVLKYYGREESYYDLEVSYLDVYETVNKTVVKGNGSGVGGHHFALKEWGYESKAGIMLKGSKPLFATYEDYVKFMRENLEAGRPIPVIVNPGGGHFVTVIGFDDMGTDYIYDDVFVVADSSDYWDGYQDGYNVHPAYKFFTQHTNGRYSSLQNYIIIYDKE